MLTKNGDLDAGARYPLHLIRPTNLLVVTCSIQLGIARIIRFHRVCRELVQSNYFACFHLCLHTSTRQNPPQGG